MKKITLAILAVLCFLGISLPAQAQTTPPDPWSGAVYFDFRSRETALVVMHPLTTFNQVFGKRNASIDLDAFAGATTTNHAAVAGITLGKRYKLADKVTAYAGLAITGQLGGTLGAGGIVGLTVRF